MSGLVRRMIRGCDSLFDDGAAKIEQAVVSALQQVIDERRNTNGTIIVINRLTINVGLSATGGSDSSVGHTTVNVRFGG